MPKVTLYSKPDCPLCDKARRVLEQVRVRAPFELEQVDITAESTMVAKYGERIPVVAIDGREAFELIVDERELERLVTAVSGAAA
jgi:glutaredoxin